jgi:Uma2 family endonuclease
MESTAILSKKSITPVKNRKVKGISWADFQKKYLDREDGFKYEWVNREVVKSKHMDYTQFYIVRNIINVFEHLRFLGKITGLLMPEGDILFNGNHRRPDLSYLTDLQIDRTSYGENQVPKFVIEVISTKDQMNLVHEKMQNYRDAEVLVVWHVFPLINQVHVYSGVGLKSMSVCIGDDVCSATSVIVDFEMTANAIFHKKPKPQN